MKRSIVLLALTLLGCRGTDAPPPEPRDPTLAEAETWWAYPTSASVTSSDFDRLWIASENAARDLLFRLDRRDYRGGLLTTEPLQAAQFFEVWRPDNSSIGQTVEASLASERRTIRFEFKRADAGPITVTPKVLIERETIGERQLSSTALTRLAFARRQGRGSREADAGLQIPDRYWYPVARDEKLEARLAKSIERRVRK